MSRQLVALNAALVLLAIVSGGYMVRELRAPAPAPERRASAPAPPTVAPAAPAGEPAPAGGYGVVASRNLFSPNRSEAPPPPPTSGAAQAPPQPKPNLYGILLSGSTPVAYLEDPTTKRVAGYRPGDSIAGGTVKQIGADHVVLNRPEGEVSVRLRDPSKPRPPAPVAGQPGGGQPGTGVPGERPPLAVGPIPRTPVTPQAPGAAMQNPPGGATILPRRPLPPNLLRRMPPPATDAQPQN
jgi:hypothetical protein